MAKLPENVTLADLLDAGSIKNPSKYLRLALANMLQAGEFGTVELRIGRTGKGKEPLYALEQDGKIVDRFGGKKHKSWHDPKKYAHHDDNYSKDTTTAAELHALWQKVTPNA